MPDDTLQPKRDTIFYNGWRPSIGWIGVSALALQFLLIPVTNIVLVLTHVKVALPSLDTGPLIGIVTTLLGMGSLRTFEKYAGCQGNH